mmetsp:Transcript_13022/g.28117  ORF Transcript_13022/g.28117 Transcript_13022/m.28117 type:complete len:740 (-) Transcript_13022:157-2376(-)
MGLLDPTSNEPLFPLIIDAIGNDDDENDDDGQPSDDPSAYLAKADDNDDAANNNENGRRHGHGRRSSNFWMQAHELSCLKRASLYSSVEQVYDDAAVVLSASSLSSRDDSDSTKRALHLDLVRSVIGRNCACISDDGTIVSNSNNNGYDNDDDDALDYKSKHHKHHKHHYRAALFIPNSKKLSVSISSGAGLMDASERQIETAARLSGLILTGDVSKRHGNNAVDVVISEKSSTTAAASSQAERNYPSKGRGGGGWFQYPTTFAKTITNGLSYAIDKALTAYDGDESEDYFVDRVGAELDNVDDASSSIRKLLTNDVGCSTTKIALFENDVDDAAAVTRGEGRDGVNIAIKTVGEDDGILGNGEDVICIDIVACACRHLLEYAQQQQQQQCQEGSNENMFFLGHGGVERVMLNRNGWDACSFGSLCRLAGNYYVTLTDQQHDGSTASITTANAREKTMRIGEILSNISEKESNLLESTLRQSNHAIVEKDTITLFPTGSIPSSSDLAPTPSDHALFRIHVAKLTIQRRMTRLECDAKIAQRNAIDQSRRTRNNDDATPSTTTTTTTTLAMAHMRRRNALLAEVERCAGILTNLDASELRLERTRDDVQVVQSYELVREALRDIRTSKDGKTNVVGSSSIENVEELMLGVREEMEDVVGEAIGEGGALCYEDAIDEDELNKEFKRLEMECENGHSSEALKDGTVGAAVGEAPPNNKLDVQPLEEEEKDASDASRAEPVAA